MCNGRIINSIIPRHVISRHLSASDLWPNSFTAPIISAHDFIPRHRAPRLTAADPWPNSLAQAKHSEKGMGITKTPGIVEQDKWMPRFVKRTRTASESSGCSNGTQVEPQSFSFINMGYNLEQSRWSLDAERLPGGTNNEKEIHWDNIFEERLAGKRKIGDLENNLECSWPLFTETSDDEDNDGMSDSGSDSDAYSGPS